MKHMEIKAIDIATSATTFANILLTESLKKDNNFSIGMLEQIKTNIFDTKYAGDYAVNIAIGAILSYHEQLREKLLKEANIDIGEINC